MKLLLFLISSYSYAQVNINIFTTTTVNERAITIMEARLPIKNKIMQKVFGDFSEIEAVVYEILPPSKNHLIDDFRMNFTLSSNGWGSIPTDIELNELCVYNFKRGIKAFIRRASIEEEIVYLSQFLDPNYEYSDDHKYWKSQVDLRDKINKLQNEN
jgi:hypothetical protein